MLVSVTVSSNSPMLPSVLITALQRQPISTGTLTGLRTKNVIIIDVQADLKAKQLGVIPTYWSFHHNVNAMDYTTRQSEVCVQTSLRVIEFQ